MENKNKKMKDLKKLTLNLSKVKDCPLEESRVLNKWIYVERYNSSLCATHGFYKPISKMIIFKE